MLRNRYRIIGSLPFWNRCFIIVLLSLRNKYRIIELLLLRNRYRIIGLLSIRNWSDGCTFNKYKSHDFKIPHLWGSMWRSRRALESIKWETYDATNFEKETWLEKCRSKPTQVPLWRQNLLHPLPAVFCCGMEQLEDQYQHQHSFMSRKKPEETALKLSVGTPLWTLSTAHWPTA